MSDKGTVENLIAEIDERVQDENPERKNLLLLKLRDFLKWNVLET